ncbi:MAG: hypothetical protein B7Z33_06505 [Sphingomonadales bacterium 12-68-11]|nr:MAG: hypothetical protein B7Z33_06505 [Sphingomonadales bacterium 12-68-11]
MTTDGASLAPVRGRTRIEVLDILRGIAILGIFYMNIPFMAQNTGLLDYDIRRIGWTLADRNTWAAIHIVWEGTQRGLLEFLFGAGAMVLTAKVMKPDGPVAVADLFYRRNLWLLGFGLLDVFLIGWVGDILHVYALAALLIFPFRLLSARVLIVLGLSYAALTAVGVTGGGAMEYSARAQLMQQAAVAQAKTAAQVPLTQAERETAAEWQELIDRRALATPLDADSARAVEEEAAARRSTPAALLAASWSAWHAIFIAGYGSFFLVLEAMCGMFIGMALWKLGVIQGQRSKRFYALLALAAYGLGCGARAIGVWEQLQFAPQPKSIWITEEFARLAVSLGHVALINLLVQTRAGKAILAPFKAAGQTAFSLYILTSILGLWILFAPWGFDLWGRFGWAELAAIATAVNVGLLILANLWVKGFANGPLEWAWRSLAYWKIQPFRRPRGEPNAPAEPGDPANPPVSA